MGGGALALSKGGKGNAAPLSALRLGGHWRSTGGAVDRRLLQGAATDAQMNHQDHEANVHPAKAASPGRRQQTNRKSHATGSHCSHYIAL